MRLTGIACAIVLLAGAAEAGPLPPCAAQIEIANVKIVRVEKNGAMILPDGRAVVPEGILLPGGAKDHAPNFLADQAIAQLSELAEHRTVIVSAEPPKEDRYGRLRGQIFFAEDNDEPWLQVAMLRRGLARVYIAPDRRECAKPLYTAEQEARAARRGIWDNSAYAIRTPDSLRNADTGTFQIVEGKVISADVKDGRAYLDFGSDWRKDFTVTISPDDMKIFRAVGIDPRTYAGMTVRVRGWVEQLNGPEIELPAPEDLEIVQ